MLQPSRIWGFPKMRMLTLFYSSSFCLLIVFWGDPAKGDLNPYLDGNEWGRLTRLNEDTSGPPKKVPLKTL